MPAPLLYRMWVGASMALVPFFARRETRKLRDAGISTLRAHEKLGHATEPRRGTGPLIWFHAASVGESLSVLALIKSMGEALPRAEFLITSGTATSAKLVGSRLPPRTLHQFAPLDAPGPLKRFLKHWRPEAAIFVESELWPQMLRRTHATGARMALVNARVSEGTAAKWRARPAFAAYVLDVFDLILTQNDDMAQAMVAMHAPPPRVARGVNLKSMSDPLPVDQAALAALRTTLGDRPVWVASSTHAGEEEVVLEAHQTLLNRWPDLCLILAPRHPERGNAVSGLIERTGLSTTRRTLGEAPTGSVFLADTLGELGIWYGSSDIVFLGGSLLPIGGHNPFEVAQAGAVTLSGPHVTNFAETYAEMIPQGAARIVENADELAMQITALLEDQSALSHAKDATSTFIAQQADKLDSIASRLINALGLPR